MSKEHIDEAQSALKSLRDLQEKVDTGLVSKSEFEQKSVEFNNMIDKQEEINKKNLLEAKRLEKFEQELKNLEISIVKSSSIKGHKQDYKQSEEFKSFKGALKNGDFSKYYDIASKNLNRTDINIDGGYLIPNEMSNEILKNISEISPIRSLANVISISSKSIEIPRRDTLLSAKYEGETEDNSKDSSTYRSETITPYALSVTVPVTHDTLNNANSFESQIMADVVESFALAEGNNFLNGDGVKKPFGILPALDSSAISTSVTGEVSFDEIINLPGELKDGYNGIYTFNRKTNAILRTAKGTDGHYLWQIQSDGKFNTLNGFRYVIDNQLPNIANGTIPILFGDFNKGYKIVDRTDMMVIRDDFTRKSNRIVEFCFNKWNTGQVVIPEAIKALKIKS